MDQLEFVVLGLEPSVLSLEKAVLPFKLLNEFQNLDAELRITQLEDFDILTGANDGAGNGVTGGATQGIVERRSKSIASDCDCGILNGSRG